MNWLELEDVAKWIRSPGKAQLSPDDFPMFQTQDVKIVNKSDENLSGRGSLILAENMDAIWYVETKDRKTAIAAKDFERFLTIRSELKEQHPDLYIRGILLTSAPVDESMQAEFKEEECLLIHVPEEKRGNQSPVA
ncbi:MAG: hypothetical protein MAGBODY4_00126 [Candidatus Marinimicrobia bacterium]|nr:hypothetical protein [Candidatus Neomarinimicrobiota bacterium]